MRSMIPACHRVSPAIFVKLPSTTSLVPSGLTAMSVIHGGSVGRRGSVTGRSKLGSGSPFVALTAASSERAVCLIWRKRPAT